MQLQRSAKKQWCYVCSTLYSLQKSFNEIITCLFTEKRLHGKQRPIILVQFID